MKPLAQRILLEAEIAGSLMMTLLRWNPTNTLCLVMILGVVSPAWPQERPPTLVVVAPAVEGTISPEQSFVGTVMPLRHATIGSAVDGRVIERPIEEGDRVEAGQKLAQLLTDTISLDLASAEAELDLRKERLAELENGSRPEEIAQAEARMLAAEARSKYEVARHERVQRLHTARRVATEEELEEAISAATQAEQAYREAKAAHELIVAGPRREVIAQARAQVAIQEAVVDRLRDQIKKHTIVSRFAGYIVREHTELGQWVSSGDPIAEVVAIDEVEIVVQVVEKYVSFLHPGTTVAVEVPAVPNRTLSGTLVTTVPQADVRARTFPVKIHVQNEVGPDGPLLKAGMYARAVLPVANPQVATLVPKDAIVLGGKTPIVITVVDATAAGQAGTTLATPVEIGASKGGMIQVMGDILPGQLVVVQGNERLRAGENVIVSSIDTAITTAAKPDTTRSVVQ